MSVDDPHSGQAPSGSHGSIYFTSFLWAIPVCFVGTMVVTAIAFVVASADAGVDLPGSVLGGIFWGALIFLPSCLITVPIVGLTIASYRLFAADRQRRRDGRAS